MEKPPLESSSCPGLLSSSLLLPAARRRGQPPPHWTPPLPPSTHLRTNLTKYQGAANCACLPLFK